MAENWFHHLESNDKKSIEEAKREIHDLFNQVNEPWLVNGLYDKYIYTNILNYVEILINVREPHHEYLFTKLSDSMRSGKADVKYRALVLLGYLVQKQPTWLYKITEKQLFKDLIKLLKNETDILLLLNALLVLIILLPCIPSLMAPYLQDIFEIFSRFAALNWNSGKVLEEQVVHVQVALYALFQRLYGMYPCNFLLYMRNCYKQRDVSIFSHTIKPMLQTVQMHPLLVTNTKDVEISTERWKKMTSHDVVAECESYSIGFKDRCFGQDTCIASNSFRSRSSTLNSTITESPYQFKIMGQPIEDGQGEVFSPTQLMLQNPYQTPISNEIHFQQSSGVFAANTVSIKSQEGTSPPETAIEATPETTPIKDTRQSSSGRLPSSSSGGSGAARALNNFGMMRAINPIISSSTSSTPSHSQPSSPLRCITQNPLNSGKSEFPFSSDARVSAFNQPSSQAGHAQQHPKRESFANQRLQRLIQDRSQAHDDVKQMVPTSPLRIIQQHEISMPNLNRNDSPITLEDEEVVEIVNNKPMGTNQTLRQCDSVLYDDAADDYEDNVGGDVEAECEHGSPCTSGGLHMPNSKQMANFRNNIKRLRHHSQCASDSDAAKLVAETLLQPDSTSANNLIVRRTNSCPEMKKEPPPPVSKSKTLEEKEETENSDINGHQEIGGECRSVVCSDTSTQTENFWPWPYEHLFLTIFPAGNDNNDWLVKPSPAPSPAPFGASSQERFTYNSSYDYLDRYIDSACQMESNVQSIKSTREHLIYLLLLFERSRRESHAIRNRSLVTDMTKKKVLEEHNSALTDQVKLQERNIDELKEKIELMQKEENSRLKAALDTANYWELKCKEIENRCYALREENEDLHRALDVERSKLQETDNKRQAAEAALLDIEAEIKVAKEHVEAGEKLRDQVEYLNCELILTGETILKYKERLLDLNRPRKSDYELGRLTDVYNNEVKGLQQQLEQKTIALEALKNRHAEFEQTAVQYEEQTKFQKKLLHEVKEECRCKIDAIESKYKAQLSINRAFEGRLADLQQQLDVTSSMLGGKCGLLNSPDTSSCHEVNATLTDKTAGLSAHSSPLSASLASSDGSMAFAHATADVKEVRNLQTFVDQRQSSGSKSTAAVGGEGDLQDSQTPSTSKTD